MAKARVEKPFNAGTQSRAAFFGMLRSALRRQSMYWKPINLCKQAARRPYKGPEKRQKWEYQCSQCKLYHKDKQIAVHHIRPVGELKDFKDLEGFVKRLFCEQEGLCVLCNECHKELHNKTKK